MITMQAVLLPQFLQQLPTLIHPSKNEQGTLGQRFTQAQKYFHRQTYSISDKKMVPHRIYLNAISQSTLQTSSHLRSPTQVNVIPA